MKSSHDIHKMSRRQEARTASDLNAKVQANSGATRFGGADVRERGKTRVECKYTAKPYYHLKLDDLVKLREQAIRGGLEIPVFKVGFHDDHQRVMDEFAVLRWPDYLAMMSGQEVRVASDSFIVAHSYQLTHGDALKSLTQGCIRITFNLDDIVRLGGTPPSYAIIPWGDYLSLRGE